MVTKRLRVLLAVAVVLLLVGGAAAFRVQGPRREVLAGRVALSGSDIRVAAQARQRAALASAGQVLAVAAKPAAAWVPRPSPSPAYVPPAPDPGTAQRDAWDLLPSFGFDQTDQYDCLVLLWDAESGWRVDAQEPTSGAYGIPQALPASKMAAAGPDYLTDAVTQIRWGLGYIRASYGTPCSAWAHELADHWY